MANKNILAGCPINQVDVTVVTTVTTYTISPGQYVTHFIPSAATPFTATLPDASKCVLGIPYEIAWLGTYNTAALTIADPSGATIGIADVVLDSNAAGNYIAATFLPTSLGWVLLSQRATV